MDQYAQEYRRLILQRLDFTRCNQPERLASDILSCAGFCDAQIPIALANINNPLCRKLFDARLQTYFNKEEMRKLWIEAGGHIACTCSTQQIVAGGCICGGT